MLKGFLIMLVVFLVVAILGWGLSRFGNASEEKKVRIRKYLFSFYGLFLIIQGMSYLWEDPQWGWQVLNIPLGLVFIWVALSGKLEPSAKESA
ncbi:hypothetical protein [Muriicola marianensis]|uniref:Uncharacterized protein n=1 Tax=Muriicola marianensis TaxID=1324801 RepID=A0ABQ1R1T3_9FLAO|nr:hypothetical protein [Muriicola marianensis]GGD53349.1 hypothetical protein GCM10011361_20050 [Muriicola marianensis]